MKNIPLFTTEAGIASLTLDQIAFNQTAYVRIQAATDVDKLMSECVDFCRAVGAEKIYAAGDMLTSDKYGPGASVLHMERRRIEHDQELAGLVPVSPDTIGEFRNLYNEAMFPVPNASFMTASMANEILTKQTGYYVYKDHEIVGLGVVEGEWIKAIISLKRGCGETVLSALNQALDGAYIRVEVIDSNIPAMGLYQRMGFTQYETISTWFKII